jgi:hypothetical protein
MSFVVILLVFTTIFLFSSIIIDLVPNIGGKESKGKARIGKQGYERKRKAWKG